MGSFSAFTSTSAIHAILERIREPTALATRQPGEEMETKSAEPVGHCHVRVPALKGKIMSHSKYASSANRAGPGTFSFPTCIQPCRRCLWCLFLFLVAAAGIIISFGLGAALAIPVYHQFIDSSQVSYPHFMLFTGVAYSITTFPVLCRILNELKLLDTTVGIVVLSAGVGNNIIRWTLLTLSVALVNAGSGPTALWILLVCIGWSILMLLIVHRVLFRIARNTRPIENGPPQRSCFVWIGFFH